MFQNISSDDINIQDEFEDVEDLKNNKKKFLKGFFQKKNILLYIVSIMISSVSFSENMAPFGLAMFAAACSNNIPAGAIFICSLIGTILGIGSGGALTYILSALILTVLILIFRPMIEKTYRNEKRRLIILLFISSLIANISQMFFKVFIVYDLLIAIASSIAVCIFYKIFSNSIIVLKDFDVKKAFSIEEVLGASLIVAIAISAFRGFSIFGFELKNILSILLVLVMGWKNGVLVGATSGITIGTVLSIIGSGEPIMIATYAFSGMIAGLFSKLGKIGVIVGFIIGNIMLSYLSKEMAGSFLYFKEILIASLGLLLVPKNIKINIEDLNPNTVLLPDATKKAIEESEETVQKLNSVSEAISEIAQTYREVAASVVGTKTKEETKNKKIFIEELKNNLVEIEDNILYEDIIDSEETIIEDIFNILLRKEVIKQRDLIDVFAKYNNYLIGFENENINMSLEKDIEDMVKMINDTYKMSKINFIWKQKIDANKSTISNQLDGVSKVISNLAEDINKSNEEENKSIKEEIEKISAQKGIITKQISVKKENTGRFRISILIDVSSTQIGSKEQINKMENILTNICKENIVMKKTKANKNNPALQNYISEDKYIMQIGVAQKSKHDSVVSGDTTLNIRLDDGKYLIALSDGMGSGPNARKSSQIAIKMLERLLQIGFDKEVSMELINSTISLNTEEEMYATLDIAILDLYSGNIEFIKNGACPTYIKNRRNVKIIKSESLPAGILDNVELTVYDKDIKSSDTIVMVTDGIIESNAEYKNKELWVKNLLDEIETDNVQKMADIILTESIDASYGVAKDDMTVIIAKLIKK